MVKAQISVEFLIITAGLVFFLAFFMISVQNSSLEKNKEKDFLLVKNLALGVQEEISIAAAASSGYKRNFTLPATIAGQFYNINLTYGYIYVNTTRFDVSYPIKNVTGNVMKGAVNYIRKEDGKVYIN